MVEPQEIAQDFPKKKRKKKHKKHKGHVRKSKSNIFPSKCAPVSASIPEVEHEEYSVRERSVFIEED